MMTPKDYYEEFYLLADYDDLEAYENELAKKEKLYAYELDDTIERNYTVRNENWVDDGTPWRRLLSIITPQMEDKEESELLHVVRKFKTGVYGGLPEYYSDILEYMVSVPLGLVSSDYPTGRTAEEIEHEFSDIMDYQSELDAIDDKRHEPIPDNPNIEDIDFLRSCLELVNGNRKKQGTALTESTFGELRDTSFLKNLGYNANQPVVFRHLVLRQAERLYGKVAVAKLLRFFIAVHSGQRNFENACSIWIDDLKYLLMETQ